jgi:hypothetical protein
MNQLEYMINPVFMGGLVKEIKGDMVKVHLHGRLGVIVIPKKYILTKEKIVIGTEMQFYFSYLEVNQTPYDYDTDSIKKGIFEPCFLGGTISEVNDTAIKAEMMEHLGTVAVPRRWVFTSDALKEGQNIEFYFSPMKVIGKRDIPAESI